MKTFLNITATLVAMFIASCAPQTNTIYGGGGGGGTSSRTVSRPAPSVKSASEVFGNQPMNPTPDAVPSTWGATMGSSFWYNDARRGDRALLQPTSPNEPVLVSRSSGYVWRSGCYNRVTPAQPTIEETVFEPSSGGGNITQINYGPSYKVGLFEGFTFVYQGGDDGYYPQQQYRPQQRYCPPPRVQRRPQCPPGYRPVQRPPQCPPGYRPRRR